MFYYVAVIICNHAVFNSTKHKRTLHDTMVEQRRNVIPQIRITMVTKTTGIASNAYTLVSYWYV